MHNLALAGFIFGLGLLISGMADPAKVLNFLDLAGTFDPSLICDAGGRRGDIRRLPARLAPAKAPLG
jgi:uncharacterized membrane protein YedE/YeeE